MIKIKPFKGATKKAPTKKKVKDETIRVVTLRSDPAIMGGMVCIDGTRLPVSHFLKMIMQQYSTHDEIRENYPDITVDMAKCLVRICEDLRV